MNGLLAVSRSFGDINFKNYNESELGPHPYPVSVSAPATAPSSSSGSHSATSGIALELRVRRCSAATTSEQSQLHSRAESLITHRERLWGSSQQVISKPKVRPVYGAILQCDLTYGDWLKTSVLTGLYVKSV